MAQVETGTYTGDGGESGGTTQEITFSNINPIAAIIFEDRFGGTNPSSDIRGFWNTESFGGTKASNFKLNDSATIEFTSTSMIVGGRLNSDTGPGVYYFVVFFLGANITTGQYLGDGTANNVVEGLDALPNFILVQKNGIPFFGLFQRAVCAIPILVAERSMSTECTADIFTSSAVDVLASDTGIHSIQSGQFSVGADIRVNESGATYDFLSIGMGENDVEVESTATRTLVSVGTNRNPKMVVMIPTRTNPVIAIQEINWSTLEVLNAQAGGTPFQLEDGLILRDGDPAHGDMKDFETEGGATGFFFASDDNVDIDNYYWFSLPDTGILAVGDVLPGGPIEDIPPGTPAGGPIVVGIQFPAFKSAGLLYPNPYYATKGNLQIANLLNNVRIY